MKQFTFVATYGTLKYGFHNHYLLEKEEFVGTFVSAPRLFSMYSMAGHYPFLIKDEDKGVPIHFEIYDVSLPTLKMLDRLEGVSHGLYESHEIELPNGPGLVYLGGKNFVRGAKMGEFAPIPSGKWDVKLG